MFISTTVMLGSVLYKKLFREVECSYIKYFNRYQKRRNCATRIPYQCSSIL